MLPWALLQPGERAGSESRYAGEREKKKISSLSLALLTRAHWALDPRMRDTFLLPLARQLNVFVWSFRNTLPSIVFRLGVDFHFSNLGGSCGGIRFEVHNQKKNAC